MKFITLFVLFCIVFSQQVIEKVWVNNTYRGVTIDPKTSKGYDFYPQADKIRFKVVCERMCDIFLTTTENYERFQSGKTFTWHYFQDFSLGLEYQFYNKKFISQGMTVFVVNRDPSQKFRANYELSSFMVPLPWFNGALFSGIFFPSVITFFFGVFCCTLIIVGSVVIYRYSKRKGEPLIKYEGANDEEDAMGDEENPNEQQSILSTQ